MTAEPNKSPAQRLWDVVEPIAANVYFAPEVHAAYESLGFGASPGERNGVQFPDAVAYFTSRGACLGVVPGEVVAAAFGVFNPAVVVAAVAQGWRIADRDKVLAARQEGATASLRRLLGDPPAGLERATALLRRGAAAATGEGRALFSGLRSLGWPGDPMGDFWRAADLVREHRGDSHILAWASRGYDGVEIGLMTDPWRGLPFRSWVRTRAWSENELDQGAERLRLRGLLAGDELTEEGRAERDRIEAETDRLVGRVIDAISTDIEELISLLQPWSERIIEGGGYPRPGR